MIFTQRLLLLQITRANEDADKSGEPATTSPKISTANGHAPPSDATPTTSGSLPPGAVVLQPGGYVPLYTILTADGAASNMTPVSLSLSIPAMQVCVCVCVCARMRVCVCASVRALLTCMHVCAYMHVFPTIILLPQYTGAQVRIIRVQVCLYMFMSHLDSLFCQHHRTEEMASPVTL